MHSGCVSVRLMGGPSQAYGRAEMYSDVDGGWHALCDDGRVGDADAEVLCRALGYAGGRPICCSALGSFTNNEVQYTPGHYQTSSKNSSISPLGYVPGGAHCLSDPSIPPS